MFGDYVNKDLIKAALKEAIPELTEEKAVEITHRLFEHLYVYGISLLLKTEQERAIYQTLLNETSGTNDQKDLLLDVVTAKLASLNEAEKVALQESIYSELVRKGNELYLNVTH